MTLTEKTVDLNDRLFNSGCVAHVTNTDDDDDDVLVKDYNRWLRKLLSLQSKNSCSTGLVQSELVSLPIFGAWQSHPTNPDYQAFFT